MSVNSLKIWCEACHFQSSNSRIWGRYTYEFADGDRLPVKRSAGWCYNCHNIEPVEILSFEKAEADDDSKNVANNGKPNKASYHYIITSVLSFLRVRQKCCEKNMDHILRDTDAVRSKFLSLRLEPAKCLACGETNVEYIDIPSLPDGEIRPLTWMHPTCGGTLYARKSGSRFHYLFPERFYDIQGNYLRTEDR